MIFMTNIRHKKYCELQVKLLNLIEATENLYIQMFLIMIFKTGVA